MASFCLFPFFTDTNLTVRFSRIRTPTFRIEGKYPDHFIAFTTAQIEHSFCLVRWSNLLHWKWSFRLCGLNFEKLRANVRIILCYQNMFIYLHNFNKYINQYVGPILWWKLWEQRVRVFFKMGQSRPLFVLFSFFSHSIKELGLDWFS